MKYVKHMTLKEWNKFRNIRKDLEGNFVPPGNEFQYRNHFTGKIESLQTITGQELLLSKYTIIIDGYEPKWQRRYHTFTKYVNQKNLNKSMKTLSNVVDTFSKEVAELDKSNPKKKKNKTVLWRNKKSNNSLWGTTKTRKNHKKKSNSLRIWNKEKEETPLW